MKTTTMKFGGSSLCDASQFLKVRDIILSRSGRRFVVASAPGKRDKADTKVTDMLYACYESCTKGEDFAPEMARIAQRFGQIISQLGVSFDLDGELNQISATLPTLGERGRDYIASRGEYLNSKVLAAFLGFDFVDPKDYIFFDKSGNLDSEKTNEALGEVLDCKEDAVVAGFYGLGYDGLIKTFSRGGSDVTGAIVARASNSDVYENWTDVSGMFSADPRIVDNPKPIREVSYRELRELAYMGASVLHEDCVFPVRKANIPINVRNTNRPEDEGTWIVPHRTNIDNVITGITGKKGFSTIYLHKAMMNNEIGFAATLLQIISSYNVSVEHIPSGIDAISVILSSQMFELHQQEIVDEIQRKLCPDELEVQHGLSLIAVVGRGMVDAKGVAARVFKALAEADIRVSMTDSGSNSLNLIVGIDDSDYEKGINAIYEEFYK